jgi:uncharacterized MAPEG superfamily protein
VVLEHGVEIFDAPKVVAELTKRNRPRDRILSGRPIVEKTRDPMNTELVYLTLTALLTGTLWIPVVIGYARTRGPLRPVDYVVAPTSPLPHWVNRANRAHLNAVESLAPFAAVVLVAASLHVSTAVTSAAAAVYFWSRLAHAVVHITGVGALRARTVLFTVGWLSFVAFAIELLRRS